MLLSTQYLVARVLFLPDQNNFCDIKKNYGNIWFWKCETIIDTNGILYRFFGVVSAKET